MSLEDEIDKAVEKQKKAGEAFAQRRVQDKADNSAHRALCEEKRDKVIRPVLERLKNHLKGKANVEIKLAGPEGDQPYFCPIMVTLRHVVGPDAVKLCSKDPCLAFQFSPNDDKQVFMERILKLPLLDPKSFVPMTMDKLTDAFVEAEVSAFVSSAIHS